MNKKFYVVSYEYVGPNLDQRTNSETVEITTQAPRTNMSREIKIEGWLGTTNDNAAYAHGEFETIEAAREALIEEFPHTREMELDPNEAEFYQTIEAYYVGEYEKMCAESSVSWCYEGFRNDITAQTTDEEIEVIVDGYENDANDPSNHGEGFGYSLDLDAVTRSALQFRDGLKEEK